MDIAPARPKTRWLLVPFVAMALLFGLSDLVVMRHVGRLRAEADNVVQDMLMDIDLLSRMQRDLDRGKVLADRRIFETDLAATANIEAELDQTRADFEAAAAQYEALPMLPGEERPWADLKAKLANVRPRFDAVLALSRANDDVGARRAFEDLEAPLDGVHADLRELIDVNHAETQNSVAQVARLQRTAAAAMQVFALFGGAVSLGIGVVVARALQAREHRLRASAEKLEAVNRELAAYARVGEVMTAAKGFDEVLSRLLEVFMQSSPDVDTATILLREDDPNRRAGCLRVKASIGFEEEAPRDHTIAIGEGFAGAIAASRHPLLLGDAARSPLVVSEWVRKRGLRALYGVPLVSDGELVGVAHIGSRITSDFPAEVKRLFAATTGRAADAIARAKTQQDLRASEEYLCAERARLATILTSAPHGIIFVDAVDRRVETNPAAETITGYPMTGLRMDEFRADVLCRPDGSPIPRDEWPAARALRGETVSRVEVLFVRADGTPLPLLVSATPVRGPGAHVTGAVLAFEDITVFKQLERLRDEFVSIVAHDLRNPISSIFMNAEVLLRQAEGRDAIQVRTTALDRIRGAAARLGDMVKDLLDASRIDIGRLPLDRKPLPSPGTVEAIVEEVRPTLGEHPVKVEIEGEPAPILVDPLRFDQILTNLLENAAKYSPQDAPIDVRVAPCDDGVEVSVKDQGIGIAPEEIPRLFDRFYQARRAREMKAGLGLGLHIVQGLVAAHGGHIWVESEPAHGSTFHLWLPTAR